MPRIVTADIENDVNTTFSHGRKSAIGATALQLVTADTPATKGVLVKASATNGSAYVYVGNSNAVTADTTDATDGFQLGASESILVPVDNANKIWVIGSTTGLKVFWAVA